MLYVLPVPPRSLSLGFDWKNRISCALCKKSSLNYLPSCPSACGNAQAGTGFKVLNYYEKSNHAKRSRFNQILDHVKIFKRYQIIVKTNSYIESEDVT